MFGSVPRGAMVRRAGAKPGDRVFVTGSIGDAALGLALRQGATWKLTRRRARASAVALSAAAGARSAWRRSCARTRRPPWTFPTVSPATSPSSAACRGVATDIDVARVPLSDAAKAVIAADPAMLETALTGGDDYEIVCTVPPAKAESLRAAAKAADIALTRDRHDRGGRGRPLPGRAASRSPSSAPPSATSDRDDSRAV